MGSKKKLVLASLVSLMMVLAFVIGLVPNHATLGARAASGGGGRVDMVDLLNAVLDLKSDAAAVQITVSDPRTDAIIKVPADTFQASLAVRSVTMPSGGEAGNVAYGMDGTFNLSGWFGDWFSAVTTEKPYRSSINLVPAVDAATIGVRTAHYIYAFTEATVLPQGQQAAITYTLRSPGPGDVDAAPKRIFLEAVDPSIDLNKNGIPDNIIEAVQVGETWLVTYESKLYDDLGVEVGTAIRQTVVASLTDNVKAAGVVTVSPDAAITVTAPNAEALLENGLIEADETAYVLAQAVGDLRALLTEANGLTTPAAINAWAAAVNGKAPTGGQILLASPSGAERFVAIALIATKADGSYREITGDFPEGSNLYIDVAFRNLDIPSTDDVQLSAYPVRVFKNASAGYELTNVGATQDAAQFWQFKALRDPSLATDEQAADEFVARLTSASAVLAPFKVTMTIDTVTPAEGPVGEETPTTIVGDFGATVPMTLDQANAAYGVYFGTTRTRFASNPAIVANTLKAATQALFVYAPVVTTPGFVDVTVVDLASPSDAAAKPNGFKYRYKVTTAASPVGGGTVSAAPSQTLFDPGDVVELTATAATDYTFREWQINKNGTITNPVTSVTDVTVDSNVVATAVFDPNLYTLTTTVVPAQAGTIERQPNQATYALNATVNLIAHAATGYRFLSWSQDATGSSPSTSVTMTGDKNVTATFEEVPAYSLTLVIDPPGAGTVTPDTAGPYPAGTLVTLTANAADGYMLSSWEGADQDPDDANIATITITGNATVTAHFVPYWLITLAAATGGHVVGADTQTIDPGVFPVPDGTEVTLIAVADPRYSFVRWEDAAGGMLSSNATYVFTITSNMSIVPVFSFDGFTLSTSVQPGPAAGTITKTPDQPSYGIDQVVTLEATAASGYTFMSWTGAVSDTSSSTTTITMTQDEAVTAVFANVWNLTLLDSPGGHVEDEAGNPALPDVYTVPSGTTLTLVAVADARYTFQEWQDGTGNQLSTDAAYAFTVTSDITLKPIFVFDGYSLTTLVAPSAAAGTVERQPDQALYAPGTVVTLKARSNAGYVFASWDGATANESDPTIATVTVADDTTVTANFDVIPSDHFKLTTLVEPVGSGTVDPAGETSQLKNTNVELLATAANGYKFDSWTGSVANALNASTTVYMDQDRTVTANFSLAQWTLTLLESTGGHVLSDDGVTVIDPGAYPIDHGTEVTLLASADSGYGFVRWEDGAGNELSTDTVYVFTMTADVTLKPIFSAGTYTLTTSVVGGHGTIAPATGPQTADAVVNLTATPDPGYQVKAWTGTANNTLRTTTNTVLMTSDKTVTVEFEPGYELTLNIDPVGAGTVTADKPGPYAFGTVVTLTAAANTGYELQSWVGATAVDATHATVTITGNTQVTAQFRALAIFTVTFSINPLEGGYVTAVPDPPYTLGTVVTLTAHPYPGYVFVSWGGDAVADPINPLVATVRISLSKTTVTANFAPDTVTLETRVSPAGAGTVTPAGVNSYVRGSNVELLAQAASGYTFVNWTGPVNNPAAAHTFINLAQNEIVTANFVATQFWTVTLLASEHGHVEDAFLATIAAGDYQYRDGTVATFTAVPDTDYSFAEWQDESGAQVSTDATYVFTVNSSMTLKPIFTYNEVMITSVTPNEAWLFGGVVTTIKGQGFKRSTTLTLNDEPIAAKDQLFIDSETIRFVVPALNDQLDETAFATKPSSAPAAQPSTSVSLVVSNGSLEGDTAVENFVYKRYDEETVGLNKVVTTAFKLAYSDAAKPTGTVNRYVPFALDGVANNIGIFTNTTNGADFTLPLPNTENLAGSYFGLIRAAQRPFLGGSPLLTDAAITAVAGPNSQPVTNAWDFSVHFYDSAELNTPAIHAALSNVGVAAGIYKELPTWQLARSATVAGKVTFPTATTPLTAETMAKGVSTWAHANTFDYGAVPAEEVANTIPLSTPYQSTILSSEFALDGTDEEAAVKQVTVRVYDFSAFSLRTKATRILPTNVLPLEMSNLKAKLKGGSILHIHSDNGGLGRTRIGFHLLTKAGETVATEYAVQKQWDPDAKVEIDGGRSEFDVYVKIPAYPNASSLAAGTAPEVGVSIYTLDDLYPTGDDLSGAPLATATPVVVLADHVVYEKASGTWNPLPLILAVLGLIAAIAIGICIAGGTGEGEGEGEGGGGGGGPCFIATAAYGTPMAGDINTLRAFRDTALLTSGAGTAFVEAYYHVSPYIADFVAKSPVLASVVRVALVPVIMMSKVVMAAPMLTVSVGLVGVALLVARRVLRRKA